MPHEPKFKYWSYRGAQDFLIENQLIVMEGYDDEDQVALTGKGEELLKVLVALVLAGAGCPDT